MTAVTRDVFHLWVRDENSGTWSHVTRDDGYIATYPDYPSACALACDLIHDLKVYQVQIRRNGDCACVIARPTR